MTDKLTPADIVDAALARLAAGGLHALAMRQIAADLDVQQSALYWHFENKQQLLAAVADRVVAPVAAPASGGWSERVVVLAARLRAELLRYPDGAELVATAIAFRLGAQRPTRQLTDELTRSGLAPDDAAIAAAVFVHFVLGYTTDEQQHFQATALGAIERTGGGDPDDADERFRRGLHLIVTGVTAQVDTAGH